MSDTLQIEANSLYICLTQLLIPGFHWGLYFTDDRGVATRHEWAEVWGRSDFTQPAKAYQITHIDPVTVNDIENHWNLAFAQVSGYSSRPHSTTRRRGSRASSRAVATATSVATQEERP